MAVGRDVADKFVYHLEANFLMGFLPAFKTQLDPDLEIVTQELNGVIAFHGKVMRIDGRRELQLLHAAGGLRCAGVFAALGFLVKEFAIIDDPANRRHGVGDDLDQIKLLGLCKAECVIERHNP